MVAWFNHARSPAQVEGIRQDENLYNTLVSQLHRAKQFSRYSQARNSRIFGWMAAQTDLVNKTKKSVGPGKEDGETNPIQVVNVFRPACAEDLQLVLAKDESSGMVRFYLALIFAVYRGSLSKVEGAPRKLKVTKAMGINAPAEGVARVLALELQKLSKSEYVVSCLSRAELLTPVQDIVCEIPFSGSGEKKGKLFFGLAPTTQDFLEDVESGKLNPLEVFVKPKDQTALVPAEDSSVKAAPDAPATDSGFSVLDFMRGKEGMKNIKAFILRLPKVYEDSGLKLLDAHGHCKVDKDRYKWDHIAIRCSFYFELFEGSGPVAIGEKHPAKLSGHHFSRTVYSKLAECLV